MDHSDYISFFEDLATKHKSILHSPTEKHFFRANIEEVITGLRSKIKFPAMVLESYEVRLIDYKSDNIYMAPVGAFSIIDKVERDNYDKENEAINTCMLIGIDIITAIREEYQNFRNNPNRKIKYFDPATVTGYKVGPLFENCFGYRFEFQIGNPLSLKYDASKWN